MNGGEKTETYEDLVKMLGVEFPNFKKKALEIIVGETTLLHSKDLGAAIDDLINNTTSFELLKPSYVRGRSMKSRERVVGITRTMKSFGLFDEEGFYDSSEIYDKSEEVNSVLNYEKNYKRRLGKKLLLLSDDIEKKSLEELEGEMERYLNSAIDHVRHSLRLVGNKSLRESFKSEYYDNIHNLNGGSTVTIFGLFKQYADLEVDRRDLLKSDKYQNDPKNFERHLHNIQMGQYEIQRILALTSLYIDRERTLTYKHVQEEQDFLTSQIREMVPNADDFIKSRVRPDEPLYDFTQRKTLYWKSNGDGTYEYSDEAKTGYGSFICDSMTIEGKYRDYDTRTQELDIVHVGSRMKKNAYSSVSKYIRKELSSFDEILDHKGFIFVLKSYDDEKKLIRILENELGTLRTSWIEEPKHMNEGGNSNTNSEYDSVKGVLKVNYGGRLIRDFFNSLLKILKPSDSKKFKSKISSIKGDLTDADLSFVDDYIEKITDRDLYNKFRDLKSKFGEKNYNISVEIQIFDLDNYTKAESDINSPANHEHYKKEQSLENLARIFPTEIYGEEPLRQALEEELPMTMKYQDYELIKDDS